MGCKEISLKGPSGKSKYPYIEGRTGEKAKGERSRLILAFSPFAYRPFAYRPVF
jgi:hypothetical protein